MTKDPIHRKMLVVRVVDERRRKLLFGSPRCQRISGEEIQLGRRNFGFFQSDFLAIFFSCFSMDFSADCQWTTGLKRKKILCLSKIVILLFFQEEVSSSVFYYQCYASNNCVTNMFAES